MKRFSVLAIPVTLLIFCNCMSIFAAPALPRAAEQSAPKPALQQKVQAQAPNVQAPKPEAKEAPKSAVQPKPEPKPKAQAESAKEVLKAKPAPQPKTQALQPKAKAQTKKLQAQNGTPFRRPRGPVARKTERREPSHREHPKPKPSTKQKCTCKGCHESHCNHGSCPVPHPTPKVHYDKRGTVLDIDFEAGLMLVADSSGAKFIVSTELDTPARRYRTSSTPNFSILKDCNFYRCSGSFRNYRTSDSIGITFSSDGTVSLSTSISWLLQ